MSAEQRFKDLALVLPQVSAPAGNYAAVVQSGNLLFISGKAPLPVDGKPPKGQLGREYSSSEGYALARSACLDLIGVLKNKLGSLDKVAQVVELHGSINAAPEFEEHAKVLDGASDLLAEVFGSAGVHARSVIGVSSLRNGVPLTVKAIIEVKPVKETMRSDTFDSCIPERGGGCDLAIDCNLTRASRVGQLFF